MRPCPQLSHAALASDSFRPSTRALMHLGRACLWDNGVVAWHLSAWRRRQRAACAPTVSVSRSSVAGEQPAGGAKQRTRSQFLTLN